jgi:hypothetical protein
MQLLHHILRMHSHDRLFNFYTLADAARAFEAVYFRTVITDEQAPSPANFDLL